MNPLQLKSHTHLTQLTVNRLPRRQAMEVIRQVAHGKVLPSEVVEQLVAKTDGVPLFGDIGGMRCPRRNALSSLHG